MAAAAKTNVAFRFVILSNFLLGLLHPFVIVLDYLLLVLTVLLEPIPASCCSPLLSIAFSACRPPAWSIFANRVHAYSRTRCALRPKPTSDFHCVPRCS